MYEYVSDVLRAKRIDPKDVMLIRHTDKPPEHRFRKAKEAGFIKEYTAMQKEGFAKKRDYLMVFIGEPPTIARPLLHSEPLSIPHRSRPGKLPKQGGRTRAGRVFGVAGGTATARPERLRY